MLSILLINDNKIVSRLFQLSSQKHNYDLEENKEYRHNNNAYNILFVDSKSHNEESLKELKEEVTFDKTAYLCERGESKPDSFDLLLEKPFLPTDFVNLMNENFKVMDLSEIEESSEEKSQESLDELDLDSLEEIKIDDELEDSLEEIKLDDGLEPEDELDLDSDLKDVIQDDVDDVLSEIDELDKDSIQEDIVEPNEPIVSEDLVKESIQEVQESIAKEPVEESLKTVAAISATAAAATVATNSITGDDKLNILDDELSTLNETDLKRALSEEVSEVAHEAVAETTEKVVEPGDLEEIINKAVAKALENMDIVVSFKPKSS